MIKNLQQNILIYDRSGEIFISTHYEENESYFFIIQSADPRPRLERNG